MDINKLVRVYVKIRDAKLEAKKAFEAQDAELKGKMEQIGNALLAHLNANNTESVRTEEGTVFRQEDVMPRADDWTAIYDWIKANDAFDILERRVKKTFVKEYMKGHDGAIPPGVSVMREYTVCVRRA